MKFDKTLLVVAVMGAALAAFIAQRRCADGQNGNPPGDIIIIRPTKPTGNATYWTIGGTDAASTVETEYVLNKNAFGEVNKFDTSVTDPDTGQTITVRPKKISASFFTHCSVTHGTACGGDSDCPTGETCLTTSVRVEKVRSGGSFVFRWTLVDPDNTEHVLSSKDYGDSSKWRSDLCGVLAGPARVTWTSANGDKEADLSEPTGCKMETK